uniref:Putative glycosyltransferase MJ1607 n=1 Tax=Anthurium amnicola TaxID=1678845 RepID=A0A1D1YSR0_9ARAE
MGYSRPKKSTMPSVSPFHTLLFSALLVALPALLLLGPHHLPTAACTSSNAPAPSPSAAAAAPSWSGDLRRAHFSWNRLQLPEGRSAPPPEPLKIAVFSRKWPAGPSPGGMERHALTLHTALARRGHRVHVFTSAPPAGAAPDGASPEGLNVHFLGNPPGQWRSGEAWSLFKAEDEREAFDVVHSESVALPHRLARDVPNLAVTWHGIALEALQSNIYQALASGPEEPMLPALNSSLSGQPLKVLQEIRFFNDYAHHVAISDSSGEMLRDVYQIPAGRVHVIVNGVDDEEFAPDEPLGRAFRDEIGLPANATLVMGVAGRLVRDKGHPLLHEAFSRLMGAHPGVYLVVAGSGPWAQRYADLRPRVVPLGAMPPSRLKAFYNAVDVFVNPTLRPQGLDLTLMEAMQCGTPVMASRLPSIKGTVLVDEEFGHTFAPNAEALLEALEAAVQEGPRRLAERGRACRAYAAAMFTARKMAAAYERLFLCMKNETYCGYPLTF